MPVQGIEGVSIQLVLQNNSSAIIPEMIIKPEAMDMCIQRNIQLCAGFSPYIHTQVKTPGFFACIEMRTHCVYGPVFGIAANTQAAATLLQRGIYVFAKPVDVLQDVFGKRGVVGSEIHYQQGFMIAHQWNNGLEGGLILL